MGKNIFDFGDDFAELFKFFGKISRGMIPRRVTHDPGSQLPILELFAQAFKGTVSQQ